MGTKTTPLPYPERTSDRVNAQAPKGRPSAPSGRSGTPWPTVVSGSEAQGPKRTVLGMAPVTAGASVTSGAPVTSGAAGAAGPQASKSGSGAAVRDTLSSRDTFPSPASRTRPAGTSAPPPSGSEQLKRAVEAATKSSPAARERGPRSTGSGSDSGTGRPEPMVIEPEANTSVTLQAVAPAADPRPSEKMARAEPIPPPNDGVRTVVGVPVIQDPRAAKAKAAAEKAAAEKAAKEAKPPSSKGSSKPKRQTLIQFGGAPSDGEDAARRASDRERDRASAPPIVVPAPGAQAGKNAVTRPPPWGEGAVEIGPAIPKSPPLPRIREDGVEELSGSMLVEQTDDGPMVRALSPSRPPEYRSSAAGGGAPAEYRSSVASGGPAAGERAASHPPKRTSGGLAGSAPAAAGSERRISASQSGRTAPMPMYSPRTSARPAAEPDLSGYRGGDVSLDAAREAPFPWLKPVFDRFPALYRAQEGKPRLFFPLLFGLGVLVLAIGAGAGVKALTAPAAPTAAKDAKEAKDVKDKGSTAPEAAQSSAAAAADPKTTGAAGAAVVTPPPPCGAVGRSKSIAPQVVVASGVEVATAAQGIALGFASGPKEAISMVLDPNTLAVVSEHTSKAPDLVRRVTPIPAAPAGAADAKAPSYVVAVDRKGDPLEGRRTSAGPSPIDFGTASGHLVWAARSSDKSSALWSLPGDAPVEALRAVPLDGEGRGYAITFRRSGAIWTGTIAGTAATGFKTSGELSETKGLGAQVGSPSIAASGDAVFVLWADRATADEPWALRFQRSRIGQAPEPAKTFEVPPGGLGAPYMSPSVTALGGGRFLVVWTEGPVSSHQVRALTLDADGRPQGAAFVVSSESANAGQGQAAVLPDGRGAVAYLVAEGKGFELMASSISCPRP
ncbi:hypothetical protein [Pendulispora albinea]|uniref:Uncharacterized protein n=1 Tax=Pendulispora albinea TaxID=2741071 RepID=A0ABZ2LWH8_9BACT